MSKFQIFLEFIFGYYYWVFPSLKVTMMPQYKFEARASTLGPMFIVSFASIRVLGSTRYIGLGRIIQVGYSVQGARCNEIALCASPPLTPPLPPSLQAGREQEGLVRQPGSRHKSQGVSNNVAPDCIHHPPWLPPPALLSLPRHLPVTPTNLSTNQFAQYFLLFLFHKCPQYFINLFSPFLHIVSKDKCDCNWDGDWKWEAGHHGNIDWRHWPKILKTWVNHPVKSTAVILLITSLMRQAWQ